VFLLLGPLLYWAAVRATSPFFLRRRPGLVPEAAAWSALAVFFFWARATVDGPWGGRADHLIAQNAHWEFLASVAREGSGTSGPLLEDEFPKAYLADFRPVPRDPPVPLPAFSPRRPRNVLLVVLESTGAQYLSVMGSRYPTTPSLEREAAHARVFDR